MPLEASFTLVKNSNLVNFMLLTDGFTKPSVDSLSVSLSLCQSVARLARLQTLYQLPPKLVSRRYFSQAVDFKTNSRYKVAFTAEHWSADRSTWATRSE